MSHVDGVLASCSGSLYVLRVHKAHGLPTKARQEVDRATTINHILYAPPAWWALPGRKLLVLQLSITSYMLPWPGGVL